MREGRFLPFFVKDSDPLYYEDQGSGEPIVLINGFGRNLRHWIGFDKLLAGDCRVITIDNRGVGRSSKARIGWDLSIFDMADDVSALMEHLQLEKAHIVGLSMGGMITMAFGIKYPELAKSLTIMNSSIAGQKVLQVGSAGIWKFLEVLEDRKRFNFVIGHLLVSRTYPNLDSLKEKWQSFEELEPFSIGSAIKQFAAIKKFRVKSMLSRIDLPTMIVKGSDDQFVPNANSDLLHELIANSKLVNVPGGGHEMTIDHPKEVKQIILTFVEEVAARERKEKAAA
jgi:pimeloyl-ACP methyl ester carboxylesterase